MTERAPLRKGGVNGNERAVRSAVQLTESAAIRGAAEEMRAEGMPPDALWPRPPSARERSESSAEAAQTKKKSRQEARLRKSFRDAEARGGRDLCRSAMAPQGA
jgi:hypothetical protein